MAALPEIRDLKIKAPEKGQPIIMLDGLSQIEVLSKTPQKHNNTAIVTCVNLLTKFGRLSNLIKSAIRSPMFGEHR